jgi:acyl-CoA synthetase (AMP-forming)/AMP-acid ligase II
VVVRDIIRRSAHQNHDRIAVVSGSRRISYGEAWERGCRLANGLYAYGLTPGDQVAVLENNGIAAFDFYLGCAAGNLVRVPLYARNARRGHVTMLNNTGARALVVDGELADEAEGLADEVPTLERIIVRDGAYERWLAAHSPQDPDPPISERDLSVIRHTGGTTGSPKAVPITNRCWCASARDWFYPLPPPVPGDPIIHAGPISHASGYTLLPVFAAGGIQVMVAGLQPDALVETMISERVAYGFLPPTMLAAICRVPAARAHDWSHAKCYFTGSAPISDATIALARETFGDRPLYQMMGQTEAIPLTAMGPEEWFAEGLDDSTPLRSCGKVIPWVELEIRDDDNQPLPVGEVGEIAVRCDGQFEGFYGDPDETERRLIDGWVLMGDMGRLDRHGYLYLVDRKHDMIVSGGYNLYPVEIENVIAGHPAVLEVAVFGIPHEKWGETPMAVCVIDPDRSISAQEVLDLVAAQLGSYMKPGRVELRTEPLPRSAVGKLMRRILREPYWQGREQRVAGA